MNHEMNLSDVECWRHAERWIRFRHGSVTVTVRGSDVDINECLYRWAPRYLWPILLTGAAVGLLFVIGSILQAIISGRVQQILDGASKVSQ